MSKDLDDKLDALFAAKEQRRQRADRTLQEDLEQRKQEQADFDSFCISTMRPALERTAKKFKDHHYKSSIEHTPGSPGAATPILTTITLRVSGPHAATNKWTLTFTSGHPTTVTMTRNGEPVEAFNLRAMLPGLTKLEGAAVEEYISRFAETILQP